MVTIRINGRAVQAPAGSYLIETLRGIGLEVPALCYHSSLEPYGACRLCVVEVAHPDWRGRPRVVTSCNYPVREGLEVFTHTPRVLGYRRDLFELLLARCPENPVVQQLARKHAGITSAVLDDIGEPTNCVLCGLCVRVCEEHSTGVLGFRNRGSDREVAAPQPIEDCVGCIACALLCPTEAIAFMRERGWCRIWEREITVPRCDVDAGLCRACGLCEEACGFEAASVRLFANGRAASLIQADHCQGCGACAAACPTGAITQEGYAESGLLSRVEERSRAAPHVVILDCPRSPLPEELRTEVIQLPCIGRTSLSMLMSALLAGARKVVLLGRAQETCHFSSGENHAREKADAANRLAGLMGLGWDRIEVGVPATGPDGPAEAVRAALSAKYPKNPLEGAAATAPVAAGYDAIASALVALCERGVTPDLTRWKDGLALSPGAETLVYVHRISVFEHLSAAMLKCYPLRDVLAEVLEALRRLGIEADIISGRAGCQGSEDALAADAARIAASGCRRVLSVCSQAVHHLAPLLPGIEVRWLDEFVAKLAQRRRPSRTIQVAAAAGAERPRVPGVKWVEYPLEYGAPTAKFAFALAADELARLRERSVIAGTHPGVRHLLCECPGDLLQMSLLLRRGTWRTGLAEPVTLVQLACRAIRGERRG